LLLTPYVLLPVLAAVVLFAVAIPGIRARHVPGALPFGIAMLLSGFWGLTYALEVGATEPGTKILAQQLRFPALAGVPVCLFWMGLEYTGRREWLTRGRMALLLVIPTVASVAGITMPYHHLLRSDFQILETGHLSVRHFGVDPLFHLHVTYCNGLLLATVFLLAKSLVGAPPLYRLRVLILIVSILLPTASNALFLAGISPIPGYNISPSVTMFTGLLLAWGVFRLRLMELVPIARTTVIDTLSDLVIVLDTENQVVDMNPSAQRVLGLPRSEAVGKPMEAVFAKWDGVCERLYDARSGTEEVSLCDGQDSRAYQATISPIKGQGGGVLGRVLMLHDVTDLYRAREAAESATHAKSAFLASVSHEIRTPMNVILGFAQLLARDASLSARHQSDIELIRSSGEHLLSLLNDTLDLSSIEAGRMVVDPTPTDLHSALTEIAHLFRRQAEEKGLSFSFTLDTGLPRFVQVDARRLRQILINLLSNAVKFTLDGSVTLRAASLPNGGSGRTHRLRFTVADTGIGLTPSELTTLFEPFTQASGGRTVQEGTGLGLALSHQLARLMDGSLQVESELGRGSSFTLDLPVSELPSDVTDRTPPPTQRRVLGLAPDQPQRRILVVDDHAPSRHLLASLLTALGSTSPGAPILEIREAGTAAEALASWDSWQPHLIFLDRRLPDRSGVQVAEEIRTRGPNTRPFAIIGLSASVFEEDRAVFLRAGCRAFLGKPYRDHEVFAVLAEHLGMRFLYEGDTIAA
jgi:PAS domain S-box-containing protein